MIDLSAIIDSLELINDVLSNAYSQHQKGKLEISEKLALLNRTHHNEVNISYIMEIRNSTPCSIDLKFSPSNCMVHENLNLLSESRLSDDFNLNMESDRTKQIYLDFYPQSKKAKIKITNRANGKHKTIKFIKCDENWQIKE